MVSAHPRTGTTTPRITNSRIVPSASFIVQMAVRLPRARFWSACRVRLPMTVSERNILVLLLLGSLAMRFDWFGPAFRFHGRIGSRGPRLRSARPHELERLGFSPLFVPLALYQNSVLSHPIPDVLRSPNSSPAVYTLTTSSKRFAPR